MQAMASGLLGRFEFNLLAFVADHPGLCVREIHQQFGKPQGYIRGTIVKAMDRLHKKGLVLRDDTNGLYVYTAVEGREDLDRRLVESFVRERLGGRLGPIAAYFAGADGLDPDELRALKETLDSLEP